MTNPKNSNRGTAAPGVNPQGYSQDGMTPNPKSQLEQKAKKSNTKI
ncbi:small, acid-soluble spore protein L [Bacillus sp. Marseille-P3661]|nr:small, acid-soluble spore protein L [Bacillus sp. Marseille-P3661]